MSALIARLTQAFRSLPTTGTTVAVVLSAVLALGIAGPLVYRALDDGGGGGDTTTVAGPDTGGRENGDRNGGPDGDAGTDVTEPPAGSPGGGSDGGSTGDGGTGTTAPPPSGEVPPPDAGPAPTVPPPTTTPPTTNPPIAPDPVLLVSKEPNRAGPVVLDGAVVTGLVFPFVADANAVTDTVDFFWDDPDMKGAPFSTDPDPEFDFCGTDIAGLAIPFNTLFVPNGSHVVTAKVTGVGGTSIVVSAKVEIRNVVTVPPVLPCELPVLE